MFTVAGVVAAIALTVTTQNVRYTLPPDQAHHDIDQAAAHSSILFTQEMGQRHARRFAPDGWGTAHHLGPRNMGDCATYWKRSTWHLASPSRVVQLTRARWFANGERTALVTVLRGQGVTVAAVCLHMITGAWVDLPRRPVYRHGMRRLATLLDHLRQRTPYVLVGGDWNMPWRWDHQTRLPGFPAVRLPKHGMRSISPSVATGPRGGRIDYFYWRRHAVTETGLRIIGHTFSDHQGTRIHLRLG